MKARGEKGYRFDWHRVVLDTPGLRTGPRLLAGVLAHYLNDQGVCWPHRETLTADCAADDKTILVDPLTGLSFEVAVYRQYLQVHYQVRLAWGWAAVKPEHICILMGQS